jgi:plasmid stabilization system protein ParE
MKYHVRFTEEADADLERLYEYIFQREEGDLNVAERAMEAIRTSLRLLETNPFAFRRADGNALQRELVIGFSASGYVALYEIEDGGTVTVLAVRHQREDDYH